MAPMLSIQFHKPPYIIAIAYALRDEPSLSEKFASFLETFFVSEATKMNPNVDTTSPPMAPFFPSRSKNQ
jgi:hypothetical protein